MFSSDRQHIYVPSHIVACDVKQPLQAHSLNYTKDKNLSYIADTKFQIKAK